MPNGYTATLHAQAQDFDEFVLGCARAFGALIEMRDLPSDAPIPDQLAISPHYEQRVETARARLAELGEMTALEIEVAAAAAHHRANTAWTDVQMSKVATEARYRDMYAQVAQWNPPSPDHVELKEFMLEQLARSIEWDCSLSQWKEPLPVPPTEWHRGETRRAGEELEQAVAGLKAEQERVAGRNQWVKQLRQALPPAAVSAS